MEYIFKNYILFFIKRSLLFFFCFSALISSAQKKEKVYMKMDYKQIVNEYRLVEVTMRTRVDGKFQPIPNTPVDILMETDEKNILLATIQTDSEGNANLAIDKSYSYFKDENGKYTLLAKFKGNDTFKKANKKIKARDLIINADFNKEESELLINIEALEFVKDSLTTPIDEIKFEIFVDRMFADLQVASGNLINGKAKATIANNIPGNEEGNITLHIKIDEKDYQLVEYTKTINWGVPLLKEKKKSKNAATISYVAFMILSTIIIAIFGLLLSRRINNKS